MIDWNGRLIGNEEKDGEGKGKKSMDERVESGWKNDSMDGWMKNTNNRRESEPLLGILMDPKVLILLPYPF